MILLSSPRLLAQDPLKQLLKTAWVPILKGRNRQLEDMPLVVRVRILPHPRLLKQLILRLLVPPMAAVPPKELPLREVPLVGKVLLVI